MRLGDAQHIIAILVTRLGGEVDITARELRELDPMSDVVMLTPAADLHSDIVATLRVRRRCSGCSGTHGPDVVCPRRPEDDGS